MCLPVSLLGHPAPVRHLSHLPAPRRRSQATSSRPSDRAIFLISVYGLGEGEGDGEAAGDAVGEGDGEVVGDAVGGSVVAGPVEGLGVRMVAVPSGRCSDGSYGPLSTADNAAAPTTANSKHAGASTITSGTRTNGGTNPSKTYHNNAPNTTTTGTDSHHGNPRINRPLPSYTLPSSYPVREELF
jgi:hypothetical protein